MSEDYSWVPSSDPAGGLLLPFVLVEMPFSKPKIMRRDLDQLVDGQEDLLFDDLGACNRNSRIGCWFSIPCCPTRAWATKLRYNS